MIVLYPQLLMTKFLSKYIGMFLIIHSPCLLLLLWQQNMTPILIEDPIRKNKDEKIKIKLVVVQIGVPEITSATESQVILENIRLVKIIENIPFRS